jgi:hypothetical protein
MNCNQQCTQGRASSCGHTTNDAEPDTWLSDFALAAIDFALVVAVVVAFSFTAGAVLRHLSFI